MTTLPEQIPLDVVYRADRPTRVEIVQSDDRPSFLFTLLEEDRSVVPSRNKVVDLATWEVRGLLSRCWKTEAGIACGLDLEMVNTEGLTYFSMPRPETTVFPLTTISAVSPGSEFDADVQPDDPQFLLFRVANLVTTGSIQITGFDANGEDQSEIIAVVADGEYQSQIQYRAVADDGLVFIGEFDVEAFIYNGKALAVIDADDISEPGLYSLRIELVKLPVPISPMIPRDKSTFPIPVFIHVWPKRSYPLPEITVFDLDRDFPGSTVIVDGRNFLDVYKISYLDPATGILIEDTSIVALSDRSIEVVLPLTLVGGLKQVTVTGPGGVSAPASFPVLPLISSVDPVANVGGTITIVGDGLSLVTTADLITLDGLTVYPLLGVTVIDDETVTAVVDSIPEGEYLVRASTPLYSTNSYRLIEIFDPPA